MQPDREADAGRGDVAGDVPGVMPGDEGAAGLAVMPGGVGAAGRAEVAVDGLVAALGSELVRLQRLARLLAGSRHDADDLLAEALAAALPAWRAGRVRQPVAYLRTTMVRQLGRWGRRVALARRRDHVALNWLRPAGADPTEYDERDRTMRALARLAPRRRAVVVLRFYDDLSEGQIAEALGISAGTVKSQLSRALEQLRPLLGAPEGT